MWGAALGLFGAISGRADCRESGERGVHTAALFSLLAATGLGYALMVGDLHLRYVASWASAATPLPYRIGAVWAGPSGVLLVWATVLGVGTALAVASLPRHSGIRAWVSALLALLLVAVLAMAQFDTNPFRHLLVVPDDGRGVPLEWMRPIVLMQMPVGYVAQSLLSVPAVIAVMGALGSDERWRPSARRWTFACWSLLTLAMLLDWRRRYGVGAWADDWRWAPVHAGTAFAWLGASLLAAALAARVRVHATLAAAGTAFALGLAGLTLRRAGGWGGVHDFAASAPGRATGWVLLIVAAILLVGAWASPARAALGRAAHVALGGMALATIALVAAGFVVRSDVALAEGARTTVADRFGTTWTLTLDGVSAVDRGNVGVGIVALRASVNGRSRAFIAPELRATYPAYSSVPSEELQVTGIASLPAQDLRIDAREVSRGDAVLQVRFVPLVTWLWLGGAMAAVGMLLLALAPVDSSAGTTPGVAKDVDAVADAALPGGAP